MVEGRQRVLRVVLRAEDDEHAAVVQAHQLTLEVLERQRHALLADFDAGRPELADDAAPKSVVEVHGGHLASSDAALDGHTAGDDVAEQRVPGRVEAHAAEVPQARVVHRGPAYLARAPIEVGDHHPPPQLAEFTYPCV